MCACIAQERTEHTRQPAHTLCATLQLCRAERLLLSGAREADIVQLVRAMQVQLLVDLTQILDDPSDNDEGVRWGLWRMDRRGLPLWQLADLRLDVLDVDPADDV